LADSPSISVDDPGFLEALDWCFSPLYRREIWGSRLAYKPCGVGSEQISLFPLSAFELNTTPKVRAPNARSGAQFILSPDF
jgi:hypothetical protein